MVGLSEWCSFDSTWFYIKNLRPWSANYSECRSLRSMIDRYDSGENQVNSKMSWRTILWCWCSVTLYVVGTEEWISDDELRIRLIKRNNNNKNQLDFFFHLTSSHGESVCVREREVERESARGGVGGNWQRSWD